MKKRVAVPGIVLSMVVLAALGGCSDDNRREFPNGFENDVAFPIEREPPQFSGPESLRLYLVGVHMAEDDRDCMVSEAFPDSGPREPEVIDVLGTQGYPFTAEQLNELATRCDVDFSVMWESID